jgi:hypothetical protein
MSELPVTNEGKMAGYDVEEPQIFLGHAPILEHKYYEIASVFTPENLLREARRQKGLADGTVPAICVFDPDGDLVDYLRATHSTSRHPTWACYHTTLDTFLYEGIEFGVIGRAVGASFAVLVAEELFASGCELLISITSAGQIIPLDHPPYVMLIEKRCVMKEPATIIYLHHHLATCTRNSERLLLPPGTIEVFGFI